MTQTTPRAADAQQDRRGPRAVLVAVGAVAVTSAVANLAAYAVARASGADLEVARPDGTTMTVGAIAVLATTLGPLVLAALALLVADRWGGRGWTALAWAGLCLGLLTVAMPLGIDAGAGTTVALAAMHVLSGVIWFGFLRRRVHHQVG